MSKIVKLHRIGLGNTAKAIKQERKALYPLEDIVTRHVAQYFTAAEARMGRPAEKLSICFAYIFKQARAMLIAEGGKTQVLDSHSLACFFVKPDTVKRTGIDKKIEYKAGAFMLGLAENMKLKPFELTLIVTIKNRKITVKAHTPSDQKELPLSKLIEYFEEPAEKKKRNNPPYQYYANG